MVRTTAALASLLVFLGCDRIVAAPDAATGANPPAPPASREMPPELAAGLPRTDKGLPILVSTRATLPPGTALVLAYDQTLDDPITRWGECVGRVAACYRTNAGRLGGCVDLIEVCPSNAGGTACCPPRCIARYHALRDTGLAEDDAVDESFLAGDCVDGFTRRGSLR